MQPATRSGFVVITAAFLLLLLLALPIYYVFSGYLRDRLLISMTEMNSVAWTHLFESKADDIDKLLRGEPLTEENLNLLMSAGSIARIDHYELYSSTGRHVTDLTRSVEMHDGKLHEPIPEAILQTIMQGTPLIQRSHATGIASDTSLINAYVPVFARGVLLAIIVLELDMSEIASMIDWTFSRLSLAMTATATLILLGLLALFFARRAELNTARAKLAMREVYDPLTKVFNRKGLITGIDQLISSAQALERKVAVACIDIDRFKNVNEAFGFSTGDALLMDFAERIRTNMRDGDVLARLGDDKFAVVMGSIDPAANVFNILRRIRRALAEPYVLNGHALTLSTCIGISVAPDHAANAEDLMKCAETALRNAKLAGRGSAKIFAHDMAGPARDDIMLEADLRQAIENDTIDVYYQPQVEIETGKVVGCEALVRWRHPERGDISPTRFVPIAEESGLIYAMTETILRRACRDAMSWPIPASIAVNLSPTVLSSGAVPSLVANVLTDTRLPADRLELEMTEGVVMKMSEVTLHALRDLREIGVGIAIDDFGTGYSSLSYLAHFPFTKLKIDRAFVVASGQYKSMAAIVKAIVSMGRALDVKVIIEGVETETQLERVRAAGCRVVQGYYYSRPLAQTALLEFLHERINKPIKLRK